MCEKSQDKKRLVVADSQRLLCGRYCCVLTHGWRPSLDDGGRHTQVWVPFSWVHVCHALRAGLHGKARDQRGMIRSFDNIIIISHHYWEQIDQWIASERRREIYRREIHCREIFKRHTLVCCLNLAKIDAPVYCNTHLWFSAEIMICTQMREVSKARKRDSVVAGVCVRSISKKHISLKLSQNGIQ